MDRVHILALDHFYDQDLRALATHRSLDVRRFPYQRLRTPAVRIMGDAVATGLSSYIRPELEPKRQRYATWLGGEVQRLYLERAFDIIVLPSDTFFYVRSLPAAAHALGIPVVVVQKETTISLDTMDAHSVQMRGAAPFVSDLMTVCSERHREFWLRAGAPPDRVVVTGQPRFDMYAQPRQQSMPHRKRLLFLTYELDAYVPGTGRVTSSHTWRPLRDETEKTLLDSARGGHCDVVIKCHPQQNHRYESARVARLAGPLWNHGVSMADEGADTRELIVTADVVVGFQTTAIYEAVAAGKPVVYAAWGPEYERLRDRLVRFDDAPLQCLQHAHSAKQLSVLLKETTPPEQASCTGWYEEALGPVDGQATERVAKELARVATAWPAGEVRRDLDRRRRRFAVGLFGRSLAAEALWTFALPAAHAAGQTRRVAIRQGRAREGRLVAAAALRHGFGVRRP